MKFFLLFIALFALLTVLAVKCEDPPSLPTELPPITENGSNTFGCLINGEIYVPERRSFSCCNGSQYEPIEFDFPKPPEYLLYVSTLRLVDKDDNVMDARVRFWVDSVNTIGEYAFGATSVIYENELFTYLDTTSPGVLHITKYDTAHKIISGIFYFSALDVDHRLKIVNITEGRFDLKEE